MADLPEKSPELAILAELSDRIRRVKEEKTTTQEKNGSYIVEGEAMNSAIETPTEPILGPDGDGIKNSKAKDSEGTFDNLSNKEDPRTSHGRNKFDEDSGETTEVPDDTAEPQQDGKKKLRSIELALWEDVKVNLTKVIICI